jgi:hypothetical protein
MNLLARVTSRNSSSSLGNKILNKDIIMTEITFLAKRLRLAQAIFRFIELFNQSIKIAKSPTRRRATCRNCHFSQDA